MNVASWTMGSLLATCIRAAIAVAGASDGEDEYLSYSGTAVTLDAHAFEYGEKHVIGYRDGKIAERVVLYACRDGSPFARKTVSYVDPLAPDFLFEDASNGMLDGVRTGSGGREVFFRATTGDAEKSSALPRVPGLVVDAGFDEFVRANWQPLLAGQSLGMHFLVPSRLQDMSFRVQHLRHDRIDAVSVEVFRLKLSGVYGWFLSGIDVYYGTKDRVLIRYVGLSDLRDASGDNMKVDISFDPRVRKLGGRDEAEAARGARLAPCG